MASNNQPDVRVRLSAEGVQEVVNAFKAIQTQAQATAKATAAAGKQGAGGLNLLSQAANQFAGSIKSLLPTLSVAAITTGFIALTKHAIDTAVALGKMEQKTGISVETLSVFQYAAKRTGTDVEGMEKSLIKFQKAMNDYDTGAKNVRQATQQLFGNQNALKELTDDQRFQRVVEALGKMEPGAKRTGLALEYFGKTGAQLLPVMDKLGKDGFDRVREKAQKLGLLIDRDLVQAARNVKAQLKDLKEQGEGMATRFAAGILPELAGAGEALGKEIAGPGINGFQKVGEYAGKVIKVIVGLFIVVGKTIAFVLSEAEQAWDHFGEYAKETFKGITQATAKHPWATALFGPAGVAYAVLKEAGNTKPGENQLLDRVRRFADETKKEMADLWTSKGLPVPTDERKAGGRSQDLEARNRELEALQKLELARAENEVKILEAQLKLKEGKEKEAFEAGLRSLREYYANRRDIVEQRGNAELEAISKKLVPLMKNPLKEGETHADRTREIEAVLTEYEQKYWQTQGERRPARDRVGRSVRQEVHRQVFPLQPGEVDRRAFWPT